MNTRNGGFDIHAYMQDAQEAFSGFEGHSNFTGDEGLDLDFSGGDYNASGVVGPPPAAPYSLVVSNTTGGNLTAILFGNNIYLQTTNFGSGTGVTVAPTQVNVTYLQMLQQSAQQPFQAASLRLSSTNLTQVQNTLSITSTDANGQQCTVPVLPSQYISPLQMQSGIIDVPYPIRIDGNTYISFTILAGATLTMIFFPAEKVNTARSLAGNSARKVYGAPLNPTVFNAPRLG